MSGGFARGANARGFCARCGQPQRYLDLVSDGQIPKLNVCRDCYEPKHPQETPRNVYDPEALRHPAPEQMLYLYAVTFELPSYEIEYAVSPNLTINILRGIGAGTQAITVTLDTSSTAVEGTDFDFTSPVDITFGYGDTSQTIGLTVYPAGIGTTIVLAIADEYGDNVEVGAYGTTTVTSDGTAEEGDISLGASSYELDEANGSIVITLVRANGTDGGATATLALSSGTPTITISPNPAIWAHTEGGSKNVTLSLVGDISQDYSLTLSIAGTTGAAVGAPDEAALDVIDDPSGVLDFTSATFSANEDAGTVAITVARSAGTDGAASVQVAVTGGTATGGGVDYTYSTATLTWLDGEGGNKTATVTLIDNLLDAPNKTVTFALQNPTVAALGSQTTTTLTIIDEDSAGTIQWTASSSSVTAGSNATLTASRTGGTDNAVGVSYATSDGTAIAGTDYTAASGTLSWADGDAANKTVDVTTAARAAPISKVWDTTYVIDKTYSNGNKTVLHPTNTNFSVSSARGAGVMVTGMPKLYFEFYVNASPAGAAPNTPAVGLGNEFFTESQGLGVSSCVYSTDGSTRLNGLPGPTYAAYTTGATIGCVLDPATKKLWFAKNNVFNGDPSAGTGECGTAQGFSHRAVAQFYDVGEEITLRLAASDQLYAPPSGCVTAVDDATRAFTVTLSSPTGGATLGSPIVQTVMIGPS